MVFMDSQQTAKFYPINFSNKNKISRVLNSKNFPYAMSKPNKLWKISPLKEVLSFAVTYVLPWELFQMDSCSNCTWKVWLRLSMQCLKLMIICGATWFQTCAMANNTNFIIESYVHGYHIYQNVHSYIERKYVAKYVITMSIAIK